MLRQERRCIVSSPVRTVRSKTLRHSHLWLLHAPWLSNQRYISTKSGPYWLILALKMLGYRAEQL